MARYKHIDTGSRVIAVDLWQQLLPGTFEQALIRKSNRTDNESAKPVLSLSKGWRRAKA